MLTSSFCSLLTLSETVAMPKAVKSTKSSVLVGLLEPFEKTVTKPPLAKAIFDVFSCQYYCNFFWKGEHLGNTPQLQTKTDARLSLLDWGTLWLFTHVCVTGVAYLRSSVVYTGTVFTLTHFVRGWARTEGCIKSYRSVLSNREFFHQNESCLPCSLLPS